MRFMLLPILLVAITATDCDQRGLPPPRPNGIPSDASWAGGPDGGSFIKCSFDAVSGLNFCAVYNEFTGGLVVEGQFRISGRSRPQDVANFAYSGFDGARIYLLDGSVLVRASRGHS